MTTIKPVENVVVVRARKLLEEKHKALTESAQRYVRNSEESSDEAAKIRELLDGLDGLESDDFVPEGWLSPEQVIALKAQTEKQEAVLAALLKQRDVELAEAKAEVARVNEVQRERLDAMEKTYKQAAEMLRANTDRELKIANQGIMTLEAELADAKYEQDDRLAARERIASLEVELAAREQSFRRHVLEIEQRIKELEAELADAESELTDTRTVANRADKTIIELETKVEDYERDFRKIRFMLDNPPVSVPCGPTSESVVEAVQTLVNTRAVESPRTEPSRRDEPSKRSRFRAAVVYALGELLR